MEKKNKKHGIFNVFDLVLIGVAVVLAGILAVSRLSAGDDQPNLPAAIIGGKVTYTVEFILGEEDRDMIRVGDRVTDKIQHYNLGTVDSVEYTEARRSVTDFNTGKVVRAVIPGKVAVLVTITGSASATDKGTMVDGGYPLYVGLSINAMFPQINESGTVLYIERGQAQ